jgi:hypothetical protein
MYAPTHCFQNALAYFAMDVSYRGKMFMKLIPDNVRGVLAPGLEGLLHVEVVT